MKNNGWHNLSYNFGDDENLNKEVSDILNEACHVFRVHADGGWKEHYKLKYANMLAEQISANNKAFKAKRPSCE